jgi:phage portal protein BeeE
MSFFKNLFGRNSESTKALETVNRTGPPQEQAPEIHSEVSGGGWFSGMKARFTPRRVGVRGRIRYPYTDTDNLISWHRKNELAYSCIQKIAESAIDPVLTVETRTSPKAEWKRDDSHPFAQLIARPSDDLDGTAFLTRWLVMLHVTGQFKARIYRNRIGLPARLVPVLYPAKLIPVVSGISGTPPLYYEYQDSLSREDVPMEDVFTDSLFNPGDEYGGLAPLAVALGAVDMDAAQTEYVRAFFDNGGVPSGIIRVLNKTLEKEEADGILERWMRKYKRGSTVKTGPAVLDQNAEYQKIGRTGLAVFE